MSTILQALKRLEKSRTASTTTSQHAVSLKPFDTGRVLHRAARFSWLRSKVPVWCLLILLPAVAGIALYNFNSRFPIHQKSHLSSIQAPDAVPLQPEKHSLPSFEQNFDAIEDVPMELQVRQPLPFARPGAAAIPDRSIDTASSPSFPAPSATPTAAAPDASPMKARQPATDAERLTDGSLSIQAIAWSANPDQRIAVINNRVAREGSSIDGYSIVTIAEEAVYARKEGKLWMVRFGRP